MATILKTTYSSVNPTHAAAHNAVNARVNDMSRLAYKRFRGVPVTAGNTFLGASPTVRTAVGTSRTRHVVALDCTDVSLVFTNFKNNSSTVSPNLADGEDTAAQDNVKASILVGGTKYPVTFGGLLTALIDPGATVQSDPLPVTLTAGTVIDVYVYGNNSTAWYSNQYCAVAGGEGGFQTTTDLTAPGSAAVTETVGSPLRGPSAIMGTPLSGSAPAVLVIGDSIANGQGEAGLILQRGRNVTTPAIGGGGWFGRGLLAAGVGFFNGSVGGDKVTSFITNAGHYRRMIFQANATTVVCEYGRNDLSGSRTDVQIEADLITAWSMFPGKRVIQTTITPRSTSTDGWATLVNQTTAADNPYRVSVNTWLRAGAPVTISGSTVTAVPVGTPGAVLAGTGAHPLWGVWEAADLVESARDSGLWLINANVRTVTDAAITSAAATLTSATAAFTTADLGRKVIVAGAGTAGGLHISAIVGYTNATTVTLSTTAATTVTGAALTVCDGYTHDGTHPGTYGHTVLAGCVRAADLI